MYNFDNFETTFFLNNFDRFPCSKWKNNTIGYVCCSKIFTWSMAQGIKHGTSDLVPKISGKELLKEGVACTAGKAILPMLEDSSKPNMPFT